MYKNIYAIDNLYKASHNALKNKKSKHTAAKFWLHEDEGLKKIIKEVEEFLVDFRLKIHPLKVKLLPTQTGFVFLGHKVFKTHFRLTSKAIRRGRKKLKKVRYKYAYGTIDIAEAKNKIFGTIGFFKMGSNGKIMDELLAQTILKRK